jgi:hypothetical protein
MFDRVTTFTDAVLLKAASSITILRLDLRLVTSAAMPEAKIERFVRDLYALIRNS